MRARLAGWLSGANRLPILLLLALSCLTHLVGLGHPRSLVFDEVHFGAYAAHYCCDHQRFFDIHPPTGKLLVAGAAWAAGYRGGVAFERIGQSFGAVSPLPLRLAPALAGMALPALVLVILRLLGASPPAALLGGLLLLLDNALTIQSRMIGVGPIMLLGMFGGLACWLGAARVGTPWRRWGLTSACGALLGIGVGSKLVGLAMLGLVGLAIAVDMARARRRSLRLRRAGQGGLIVLLVLAVYLGSWWLHFRLLTLPGPGDVWGLAHGGFLEKVFHIQALMLSANDTVGASPNASPWWSWPLMLKPIYYWTANGASIWLIGNPLLWWGSSLLLLVLVVNLALRRVSQLRMQPAGAASWWCLWLPLAGFVMCYVPFMLIARVMFLYHYFPALIFALLAVVLWLDRIGWIRAGGWRRQRVSYYVVLALAAAVFVGLMPLTYGLHFGAGWETDLLGGYLR